MWILCRPWNRDNGCYGLQIIAKWSQEPPRHLQAYIWSHVCTPKRRFCVVLPNHLGVQTLHTEMMLSWDTLCLLDTIRSAGWPTNSWAALGPLQSFPLSAYPPTTISALSHKSSIIRCEIPKFIQKQRQRDMIKAKYALIFNKCHWCQTLYTSRGRQQTARCHSVAGFAKAIGLSFYWW